MGQVVISDVERRRRDQREREEVRFRATVLALAGDRVVALTLGVGAINFCLAAGLLCRVDHAAAFQLRGDGFPAGSGDVFGHPGIGAGDLDHQMSGGALAHAVLPDCPGACGAFGGGRSEAGVADQISDGPVAGMRVHRLPPSVGSDLSCLLGWWAVWQANIGERSPVNRSMWWSPIVRRNTSSQLAGSLRASSS